MTAVDPEALQKTIQIDDNTQVVAVSANDFRKFFSDYYSWRFAWVVDENDIDTPMNIFLQIWNTFWDRRKTLYTRMWKEIYADFPFSVFETGNVTEDNTKLTDTNNTTDTTDSIRGSESHVAQSNTSSKRQAVSDTIGISVTDGVVSVTGDVTVGSETTNAIKNTTTTNTGTQTSQGKVKGSVTENAAEVGTNGDKVTTEHTVSTYDNQDMPLTDKTESYGDTATAGTTITSQGADGSELSESGTKTKDGEHTTLKRTGTVEHANSGKRTITQEMVRSVDEYFRGLTWSIEFGKFVDMIFHDFACECLVMWG